MWRWTIRMVSPSHVQVETVALSLFLPSSLLLGALCPSPRRKGAWGSSHGWGLCAQSIGARSSPVHSWSLPSQLLTGASCLGPGLLEAEMKMRDAGGSSAVVPKGLFAQVPSLAFFGGAFVFW